MRDATIARNYAETLLVLAGKAEDLRGWGKMLTDVSTAMDENPSLRLFLESPKVSAEKKSEVIGKAFTDRMPRLMLRYIQSVVMHRRQMLIPAIAGAGKVIERNLDQAANRQLVESFLASVTPAAVSSSR